MNLKLNTPLSDEKVKKLRAGERIFLSGIVYTARDAAHKRFFEAIKKGLPLPIDLKDQVIFYASPTPPKEGEVIGSIGPTTSARMDLYTPLLLGRGLKGMIGKGPRSKEVQEAIKKHRAIYLIATGGAAAYLAQFVVSSEIACYEDLGPEAILKLRLKDFPLVVAIDSLGKQVFPYRVEL